MRVLQRPGPAVGDRALLPLRLIQPRLMASHTLVLGLVVAGGLTIFPIVVAIVQPSLDHDGIYVPLVVVIGFLLRVSCHVLAIAVSGRALLTGQSVSRVMQRLHVVVIVLNIGFLVWIPFQFDVDAIGRLSGGCEHRYDELVPVLTDKASAAGLDLFDDLRCPPSLLGQAMHLDPDFEHLTYGDVGDRRGADIRLLTGGDLLVFYAGLRPIRPCEHRLIYAIVGLFVVDEVLLASHVPASHWHHNAHTRKRQRGASDIVVPARPRGSGRLNRCLPIGEYRAGAYRVRRDLLETWGGLSVRDGHLQRSGRPPRFNDADRFYRWFQDQQVTLTHRNNPPAREPPAIRVPLRRIIQAHYLQRAGHRVARYAGGVRDAPRRSAT